MSTANIIIDGREYHFDSDGWTKEDIVEAVREYSKEWKPRVKSPFLAQVILNAILAESKGDFPVLYPGSVDIAEYDWELTIGLRGGVGISGGKFMRL